jgi:hypothetical protein
MQKKMSTGGLMLLLAGLASTSFGSIAVADLEGGEIQFEFQHEDYLENSFEFVWGMDSIVEAFYDARTLQIRSGSGPIDAGVGDYSGTDLFEFDRIILTGSERSPTEYLVFDVLQGHGDVRIESLTGIDW